MKTFVLFSLLSLCAVASWAAVPTHAYIQGGTAGIVVSGPTNPPAGEIVQLSFTVCNPTTYTVQSRVIVSLEDSSVPALAATTCYSTATLSGQWFLAGAFGGYSGTEEPYTSFAGTSGGAFGNISPGTCRLFSRPIRIPVDAVPGQAYKLNIGVTDFTQGACDADAPGMGNRYEVPVVLTLATLTASPTTTPTPTVTPTIVSNIRLVKSLTGPVLPVGMETAGYSIAWTYLALSPLSADLLEIVDTLPADFYYLSANATSGPLPTSIVIVGRTLTVRWTGSPAVSAGDAGTIQINGYYGGLWGSRTINVASARTDGPYDWTYSNPAIRYRATATATNSFTRTPTGTPTATPCYPCTSHTPTLTATPTPTPDASLVDLQVTGFYITQYPVTACSSGPATLGLLVYVRNAGVGFSGPFVVRVGSTDILLGGLLGGATDAVWFSGLNGPNNYTATIDATGIVVESDEANNSLNADVVQPTPPPTCTTLPTWGNSPTITVTPPSGGSATVTRTVTPSGTASSTHTPTGTPVSGSATVTRTVTPSGTASSTATPTGTPLFGSPTTTSVVTYAGTLPPSFTVSSTPAFGSPTVTPTVTPTGTSFVIEPSGTRTHSPTRTPAVVGTDTVSPTRTVTITGLSATITPTGTSSRTVTRTLTPYLGTGTVTPTRTVTCPCDISATTTPTGCAGCSATVTPPITPTYTRTQTVTPTFSNTQTGGATGTRTLTPVTTATPSRTRTVTPAPTFTRTISPTFGVTPIVPGCVGVPIPGCKVSTAYVPVCGCNGVTYNNSNAALCAGVGAWTNGACGSPSTPYPGLGRTWPYPVPATNLVYLGVELRTDAEVRVEVLNSRLRLLSVLSGSMAAGSGRLTLDLSGFAPGVYYYKMTLNYSDGKVVRLAVQKFVVRR